MEGLDNTVLSELQWSCIQKVETEIDNVSTVENLRNSIQLIMCPEFHQVLDICCSPNCNEKNGLICNEIGCNYRLSHKNCPNKISVEGIAEMVSNKQTKINQIKSKALEFFYQKQKELNLLCSHLMNELDQMKESGYSDAEIKFMKEADFKNTDLKKNQMAPKERYNLLKVHELYAQKRQDDVFEKAVHYFKTFDDSLQCTIQTLKLDFQQMKEEITNPFLTNFVKPSQKSIPNSAQSIKLSVRDKVCIPEGTMTKKRWANLLSHENDKKMKITSKEIDTGRSRKSQRENSPSNSSNISLPVQRGNQSSKKSSRSKQKPWK